MILPKVSVLIRIRAQLLRVKLKPVRRTLRPIVRTANGKRMIFDFVELESWMKDERFDLLGCGKYRSHGSS